MLTLIQFPWSPFCITARHILERNNIPFRLRNIPYHERDSIIRITNGHGHTVPCMIDGKRAVCDATEFGQEVARYIDRRYNLDLFPKQFEGIQLILSRYIENDLEVVGFKVNDSFVIPSRPLVERVMLVRHKERKFGRGCVEEWTSIGKISVINLRCCSGRSTTCWRHPRFSSRTVRCTWITISTEYLRTTYTAARRGCPI